MSAYLSIDRPQLYFTADMHFRSQPHHDDSARRRAFSAFVEAIPDDAALFLLGDVFDFFFEYKAVVAKGYFDIYELLYRTRRRGVDIHLLGGNHDAWFTTFFRDELGITVHGDRILAESQGRRMCLEHGDLCIPGDQGYKRLRSVIRNPGVIKASRIVHPDWMDRLAERVSYESKKRSRTVQEEMAKELAEMAPSFFFGRGNDIFVMGHVHFPIHRIHDGKEFMIVGDWIEHCTYGKLQGGKLSLEKVTA